MTINSTNRIDYTRYATQKPDNVAQIAIQRGSPENLPTQISKSLDKDARSFKFTESQNSKEYESMRKMTHQKMLNDALLTKAVIIKKSHEAKGERIESAK